MVTVIRKNSGRRRLILILLLAVALLGAGGLAWYATRDNPAATVSDNQSGSRPLNDIEYAPATPEENKNVDGRKDDPKSNPGPTLDSQPQPADFNVTVSRVSADNTAKVLYVRTLVDGTATGSCTLKATKAGQPEVTATSQVSLQNNSYACGNFDVPYSKFPTGGDWNVSVSVTKDNKVDTATWPQAVSIVK